MCRYMRRPLHPATIPLPTRRHLILRKSRRGKARHHELMVQIRVECYAGYRGEEEPRAFTLGETRCAVVDILDRWAGPETGSCDEEKAKPIDPQRVLRGVREAGAETEAVVTEGRDHTAYFCSSGCYERWGGERRRRRCTRSRKAPAAASRATSASSGRSSSIRSATSRKPIASSATNCA